MVTTVEKKTLILPLPYLGDISLQTGTKVRKSFKGSLNCRKLQIIFKSQRKLDNVFRFRDCLPFDLVSEVVCKYTSRRHNSSYCGEMDTHLKVRSGEGIGRSPLTFNKVKPSKESEIPNCNNIPSFDEVTNWTYHRYHKYILKTKHIYISSLSSFIALS